MSMTDPISDFITQIRNAAMRGLETITVPGSRLKAEIGKILEKEGYIVALQEMRDGNKQMLTLKLKYYNRQRKNVIRGIERVSKPGGRVYFSQADIQPVASGFGTLILSTSKGLLTGLDAKKKGLGGEPLLKVW